MKKKYITLIGLLGIFIWANAMQKDLPIELTDASVRLYLDQLKNDVRNEDLQSIHTHYQALYNSINKFRKDYPKKVEEINGKATDIIFPYAMVLANSPALNRDQKVDLLGGMASIFVGTAYHPIISDEIKKYLAQPRVSPSFEPRQKFTPLRYLERKMKEALAKKDIDALKNVLQEAKTANAQVIEKQIIAAIKNLQEKLEEEQAVFFTEEVEEDRESGDDGELITYIQTLIRQAKWSGDKFDELRDIFGTLEKNHPYYEEIKKAIVEIRKQKAKQ